MSISLTSVKAAHDKFGSALDAHLPVGVDKATMLAVLAVESAGEPFDPVTGKPIIRFEVHQFWEHYGRKVSELFNKNFYFDPKVKYEQHYVIAPAGVVTNIAPPNHTGHWIALHTNTHPPENRQANEWYALSVACAMDSNSGSAALQSASYGGAQLMGFNYEACGFSSVGDMVAAMMTIDGQVKAFCNFVYYDHRLYEAAKTKSWAAFARYYNGNGQVPTYSAWIEQAYAFAKTLV